MPAARDRPLRAHRAAAQLLAAAPPQPGSPWAPPRAALAERIAAQGIRIEGQETPHLLMLAALRGIVVRGPLDDAGEQAFALSRDWLAADAAGPRPAAVDPRATEERQSAGPLDQQLDAAPRARATRHPGDDRERALAELARRYLVDGQAAATWTMRRRGDRVAIAVDPFAALSPETTAALAADADADAVARFEGLRP